jgi:peroxiredoxin
MRYLKAVVAALAAAVMAWVAMAYAAAGLTVGSAAPDFTVPAALGGKDIRFSLSEALKQGPVVVYFYPKSFTRVCTDEARLFADATEDFAALGARVIGISADTIETQREFSSLECRDRFAVAADGDLKVIKAYAAQLPAVPMARRISYVITPDGKILSSFESGEAEKHVATALAAVKAWRARQ